MGYRLSTTAVTVEIVPLRGLNREQEGLCFALRREAGRCWSEMVAAQVASRDGKWLTGNDLEKQFKGQYFLHSTCVQGLAQKLEGNIKTARKLRQQQLGAGQEVTAKFPYREKRYQTVIWKKSAIKWLGRGRMRLANRQGTPALILPIPIRYQEKSIRKAELTWRADHYELCLTTDSGQSHPEPKQAGLVAGIDLGEIHIAAVATQNGDTLLVSGRALRSVKQLRNKRHADLNALLSRCKPGSKRHRKLLKAKHRASARCYRQQRDILHKASRHVVNFCASQNVSKIAVGNVRDIQDGVNLGKKSNQKISQWAHGKFKTYLQYKSNQHGMTVEEIPEDYSTCTCSACTHVKHQAPKGRIYTCPRCGAILHRDLNGAANIASRAWMNAYGFVQLHTQMYLRPLRRSRAFDTGQGKSPDFRTNENPPPLAWGVSDLPGV